MRPAEAARLREPAILWSFCRVSHDVESSPFLAWREWRESGGRVEGRKLEKQNKVINLREKWREWREIPAYAQETDLGYGYRFPSRARAPTRKFPPLPPLPPRGLDIHGLSPPEPPVLPSTGGALPSTPSTERPSGGTGAQPKSPKSAGMGASSALPDALRSSDLAARCPRCSSRRRDISEPRRIPA